MVTTAKQISRDKVGRKVLYFDVPEKTGIVSVIGADTVLGAQMVKHLCEAGKTVYGFSQEKDFKFSLKPISEHEAPGLDYPPHPILSDWLVVCVDPQMGFEKYTSRIRNLCNYLYRKKHRGDLLFFSSTEVRTSTRSHMPSGNTIGTSAPPSSATTVKESATESITSPRNETSRCLATAEQILNTMLYRPGNEVFPHILRLTKAERPTIQAGALHDSDMPIIAATCSKALELMSKYNCCPDVAVI